MEHAQPAVRGACPRSDGGRADGLAQQLELPPGRADRAPPARIGWTRAGRKDQVPREDVDRELARGALSRARRDEIQGAQRIVVAILGDRAIDECHGIVGLVPAQARHRALERSTASGRVGSEATQGSRRGEGNAPHEAESPHAHLTVWDTRRR